jgi:two-component system NarL family response regulator
MPDLEAGGVSVPVSPAHLSRRENEVLEIIARGKTNRDVATELGVTVHAVKFHLASIYRKLGVSNRTEAVVVKLRAGP